MKKLLAMLLAVMFAGVSFHALADDNKSEPTKKESKMKGHKGGKKGKASGAMKGDKGGAMKDDKGGAMMKDDKGGK